MARQDFPEPTNAAAAEGVRCDPYPGVPLESPEAQYRTNPDLSGAGPLKLRGTFAFAALHSGQIAVVDVEDLDGLCRRPTATNLESVEDIAGCKNDDPTLPGGYLLSNRPTVSGELSCNVVAAHRAGRPARPGGRRTGVAGHGQAKWQGQAQALRHDQQGPLAGQRARHRPAEGRRPPDHHVRP